MTAVDKDRMVWPEVDDDGYGRDSRGRLMHRVAYESAAGSVPVGLELDHLCRNRACYEPTHLEAVTHRENMRRVDWSFRNKTHCPEGHPYDEVNTYVDTRGFKVCRTCQRVASLAHYRANRDLINERKRARRMAMA